MWVATSVSEDTFPLPNTEVQIPLRWHATGVGLVPVSGLSRQGDGNSFIQLFLWRKCRRQENDKPFQIWLYDKRLRGFFLSTNRLYCDFNARAVKAALVASPWHLLAEWSTLIFDSDFSIGLWHWFFYQSTPSPEHPGLFAAVGSSGRSIQMKYSCH